MKVKHIKKASPPKRLTKKQLKSMAGGLAPADGLDASVKSTSSLSNEGTNLKGEKDEQP